MSLTLPLLLSLGGCLGLSKFDATWDTGPETDQDAGSDDGGGGNPGGGGPGGNPGGGDPGGDDTDTGGATGTDGGTGIDGGTTADTGPTPGDLAVSRASIDFGRVSVGEWDYETLTLSNEGEESVVLDAIDFDSSVFSWGGEIAIPYTFSAGASRDITVNFRPNIDGVVTGSADFRWGAETTTVSLSGRGEGTEETEETCDICAPIISVNTGGGEPYAMPEFYSTCGLFDYDDSNSLTISNVGDQNLTISSVYVENDIIFTGGTFTTPYFPGTTLAPGASTSVEITYTVTSSGADVDYWSTAGLDANTVHILSNDGAEPDYVIGLTGLGVCL